ncbi:hypothetical protein ACF0H5_007979 [Mactra antiquata]
MTTFFDKWLDLRKDKEKTSSTESKSDGTTDETITPSQFEDTVPDSLDNKPRSSNPRPFGDYVYPHNLNKLSLLWGNYYRTPEEIPPHVKINVQLAADDKLRTAIFYWMMSTSIFFFLTIVYMGRRRYYQYINMISQKQNEVWAAREKLANSEDDK